MSLIPTSSPGPSGNPAVEGALDDRVAPRRGALSDLRALYAAHADFVRRAVIRLGGPHADVEDLVQDVFVVAVRRSEDFEGRSAESTWLYGIAVRVVAGARRRARLRRFLGLDEAPEPADRRSPAVLFEHRESSATLYRMLDKLAEKKRTVFILYELEELSGEEIAAVVGCPLKTVWTRLHHARKELQEALSRAEVQAARELGSDARRGS